MRPLAATISFLFVGTGLEAGVGPWLLTGFDRGHGVLDLAPLRVAGVVLIAAGLLVVLACLHAFVADAGSPSPLAPPAQLIRGRIYRHVRNPMYLATAALIAGEGLVLARPVLLGGAALYLAAMAVLVARVEAPLLRRRFGAGYEAYCAAVPGWLARRHPARW